MWSVWLVFCDYGFHSVCLLTDKDKRLMEASWWERLTEGETGFCSDGQGHAQFSPSSVQSLSRVQLFGTPWTAACQASLSNTNSWSLHKLTSIELVMPSSHLILCHPLSLLTSIFPGIRVFFNESVLGIRWPKYWSFSFSSSPSNGYSGLISFRIDWFNILAVQGTPKSLLQHHILKASILWHIAGKATYSSILAWRIPYSPWGQKELDMTERLSLSLSQPSLWSNSHIYTWLLEKA